MATQEAWRLHAYGGPENLKLDDVPIPTPTATEALIKVSHVAMNPFDWKIREGYVKDQMPLPLPYTLGVDVVGTIESLPKDSTRFKIGDRVMTMSTKLGAFAEYIALEESILARVPDQLDDAAAATLPIPIMSAHVALHTASEIQPGARVLVHGASGLVGAFVVQLAKLKGAFVIGTASGKNRVFVVGLGADQFIDYQTERFDDLVAEIDLIIDLTLIGGRDNTVDRSWKVLRKGAAIVTLADPSITFKVPDGYHGYFPEVRPDASIMEKYAKELVNGKVSSKIAQIFSRKQLVEAMETNKEGGMTGRLVVNFRAA